MFEEKLRAFCEGLEMENIDKLLSGTPADFRLIGQVMAQRIKDVASGNAKIHLQTKQGRLRKPTPKLPLGCVNLLLSRARMGMFRCHQKL